MALFIQQNDDRSKLQERLASELREKAKARGQVEPAPMDGIKDTNYLKDTKQTTSLAWVWIVIVLFIIAGVVTYIVGSIK